VKEIHIEMKLEISYLKLDHYLQLLHHGVGPGCHLVLTVQCLDTKIHTWIKWTLLKHAYISSYIWGILCEILSWSVSDRECACIGNVFEFFESTGMMYLWNSILHNTRLTCLIKRRGVGLTWD